MSDITLDVYLYFKGNCREAMEFYKDIFGGELTVQTYGDVKAANEENGANNIMHARLEGGDIKLMASDTAKASPVAAKVSLALGGSDEPRLREIFGKLSKGGKVFMELKKEFWGDIFGSVTDKYGVDWMVNITAGEAAS
ncbi:MAG TPA: VOC family protein [Candidatus Saccharimonadales bacterium]